ncbi:hypothetical protein [Sorangium sp. So ce131]|uniref:hypothetical protein n=1 Tax=Sorangium sp. So ce131 TaxID=3133282 RepID=UPI003F63D5D6
MKEHELARQSYPGVLDEMLALLPLERRLATVMRALPRHGLTPEEVLYAMWPEFRELPAKKLDR